MKKIKIKLAFTISVGEPKHPEPYDEKAAFTDTTIATDYIHPELQMGFRPDPMDKKK